MANVGRKGIYTYIDNPLVTEPNATPAAGVVWALSSDSSDTAFAKAVAAGKGLHYTGALTTTDNNMIEFCSNDLVFTPQEGYCMAEVMIQFDVVTDLAFFFGFSDDVLDTGNTIPVELSGTTFTNRAATHCGIVLDVDATYDELYCHWADGGTNTATSAANLRMTGMAPTAAKWMYLKVELQDQGSGYSPIATFLAVDHTGKSVEKRFTTSLTRSTSLCWYLGVENRAATAHNVYIRECNWAQSIADM